MCLFFWAGFCTLCWLLWQWGSTPEARRFLLIFKY